jgi:hypothetical protein
MKDRVEVCPLARGIMLASASAPIRFITKRLSLFPPSFTRISIHLPCGLLSLADICRPGEMWAYLVPCEYQNGLGLAYSPVVLRLRQVKIQHLHLTTCLLAQACQHLWLANIDDVYQRFTYVDHTIQP